MEAIIRACSAEGWGARVAGVVSNRPDAKGLLFAQAHGVETVVVNHRDHASREVFDDVLAHAIERFKPDLVVLAGFMRILTPAFVKQFEGRMINIHPSLLPAFPGLNTHQRAIDAGCKLAGATVHFVTAELDHGPIVCQAVVPVLAGDSEASLAQRVLAQEHIMLPRAVRWMIDGELSVDAAGIVSHRRGGSQLFGVLSDGQ